MLYFALPGFAQSISTTYIGHPVEFPELQHGVVQLVGIHHDKTQMTYKIASFTGNFKGADVDAQVVDAVGKLLDHTWSRINAGDDNFCKKIGFTLPSISEKILRKKL